MAFNRKKYQSQNLPPLYRQMGFWNGSAWRTRSRACAFFNKETEESNPSFSRPVKNCHDVILNTSFAYRAPKRKDTKSTCLFECAVRLCLSERFKKDIHLGWKVILGPV